MLSQDVCLSVRHTPVLYYCAGTAKHIIELSHRLVATPFQFFHTKCYDNNTRTETPVTGTSNALGINKSQFSIIISPLSRK